MSLWWGDFKGLYFAGKYLTRLRNKSTGFVRFFALFLAQMELLVLARKGRYNSGQSGYIGYAARDARGIVAIVTSGPLE
jgi:hypothetical protein